MTTGVDAIRTQCLVCVLGGYYRIQAQQNKLFLVTNTGPAFGFTCVLRVCLKAGWRGGAARALGRHIYQRLDKSTLRTERWVRLVWRNEDRQNVVAKNNTLSKLPHERTSSIFFHLLQYVRDRQIFIRFNIKSVGSERSLN